MSTDVSLLGSRLMHKVITMRAMTVNNRTFVNGNTYIYVCVYEYVYMTVIMKKQFHYSSTLFSKNPGE
jgi:hypothetical protein